MAAPVNLGAPSDAHSLGMPNVVKVRCRHFFDGILLSLGCTFDDRPAAVSINYDKVVLTPLHLKEVRTDAWNWYSSGRIGGCWGSICLEWAMQLKWLQFIRTVLVAGVMSTPSVTTAPPKTTTTSNGKNRDSDLTTLI